MVSTIHAIKVSYSKLWPFFTVLVNQINSLQTNLKEIIEKWPEPRSSFFRAYPVDADTRYI